MIKVFKCNNCITVDDSLAKERFPFPVPFFCSICGNVVFRYKPIRDVVFIFPEPKMDKIGNIYLPDDEYVGGNTKLRLGEFVGIVIAIGPGQHNNKGKFISTDELKVGDRVTYQKGIRLASNWNIDVLGLDDKIHNVLYMGYADIYGHAL